MSAPAVCQRPLYVSVRCLSTSRRLLIHALNTLFKRVDLSLTEWMARHGISLLRLSLGFIFLWFGALKFFPDLSPAQDLATRTLGVLTFGQLPPDLALRLLAVWECLIGLGLIAGVALRLTLLLLYLHLLGTIAPVFFFPREIFLQIPFAPSLEGQYIIKNLVLISAGIVVGATVRGGRLIADPEAANLADNLARVEAPKRHDLPERGLPVEE